MNRGNMLQSSPVQQMLGGGPNSWWRIIPTPKPSTSPPPPPFSQPHFPNQLAPPWHHIQELPDSLSELLIGGSVSEEDKSGLNHTQQVKKLEKWEEQLLHDHHKSSNVVNVMLESAVKRENSHKYGSSSSYGDFHCLKPNDWSNPIIPVSSPNSCISNNMLDFSTNNTNGRHPPPDRSSRCKSSGGASKRTKIQQSLNQSTLKMRKEKLGDRITALHQIVSPFGKTDTASVLLEAIGYIRFLHTQIEALSLPHLQDNRSRNTSNRQHSGIEVTR